MCTFIVHFLQDFWFHYFISWVRTIWQAIQNLDTGPIRTATINVSLGITGIIKIGIVQYGGSTKETIFKTKQISHSSWRLRWTETNYYFEGRYDGRKFFLKLHIINKLSYMYLTLCEKQYTYWSRISVSYKMIMWPQTIIVYA